MPSSNSFRRGRGSSLVVRAVPAPALYSVRAVLRGDVLGELSAEEHSLFQSTARWLDECISRPHPDLGRTGDQCPWTRRTLQLDRLYMASVSSSSPAEVDAQMLGLLSAFHSLCTADPLDTFRAIVGVFPGVENPGEAFVVAAHRRLKPQFLHQRMMLGEFYPGCPKPGIHNPAFRPLQAPHPVLVIRAMVEPDLCFLTDEDEFVEAYLSAFGQRGYSNLRQLLKQPDARIDPLRRAKLASYVEVSSELP